jgi:hypothetical protein
MSSTLTAYQVDHLFLLMGENPLPNCVAAMTMLRNGGTPYLVHTTYTHQQAICLSKVLAQGVPHLKPAKFVSLGDQQSNAYHIRTCIQRQARSLEGRLGMNYTGGTKAMSVHAYRALLEVYPGAVFSYLDPYRLAMCIDNEAGDCATIQVSPRLSFSELFQLHGLSWRNEQPPIAQPVLPEAATAFAELHQDADLARAWREWCNRELCDKLQSENGYWKDEWELKQHPSLSLQGLPNDIRQVLRQYLGASQQELSLLITCNGRFDHLRQACDWLNGIWLEHYVLQQVQQISDNYGIHESKMSCRIKDPKRQYLKYEKFEFDVAFMRDYRLFALSCTTSDKKSRCKEKLFEASLRSRQMGGTESRVALVCCYDYPDYVKSDLEILTRNPKLAVFGRQDLGNLSDKIANWIRQSG